MNLKKQLLSVRYMTANLNVKLALKKLEMEVAISVFFVTYIRVKWLLE